MLKSRADSPIARPILCAGLTALLVLSCRLLAAQPDADQLKEAEEAFNLPNWSISSSLSMSAGYRDNVLLSSVNPIGSGFLRGEVDAMFLRVPEQGFDGYVFLDVADTRFFSVEETDHELSAIVTSEARWQTTDHLKLGLEGQAYHYDEVYDVSTTEATLDTALLKVTGAALTPKVRWIVSPKWWVEGRGTGRWDRYVSDLDDFDETEGAISFGRTWGFGSELSVSAAKRWRAYASREKYTVAGRPLTGTHLKVQQREFTFNLALVADHAKRWRGRLTFLREENRDNGSGYFDFDRNQITAGVDWMNGPWQVQVSGSAARYDFPVQQVGIGIAPENRRKEEYRATLEATRRLSTAWSLLGFFESERATSNDDRSRFRVNTGYIGLQWSWDNLGL